MAGSDAFEHFFLSATENNKRFGVFRDELDLSSSADHLIVRSKQVVDKPFDLGTRRMPNYEINFYDYTSQGNFFIFVETCENAEGMGLNINSLINY